jgi:prolyl oligopeptidase
LRNADSTLLSEHIVQSKIAAPGKIAINGGSNGGMWAKTHLFVIPSYMRYPGLLVAACSNRAPVNTFGAAVAQVGVLDLLKVRKRFL